MTAGVAEGGGTTTAAARRASGFALFGLAAAVAVRSLLIRAPFLPAGVDGIAFAAVLVAVVAGTRAVLGMDVQLGTQHGSGTLGVAGTNVVVGGRADTAMPQWQSVAIGILGGVVLVAVPVTLRLLGPSAGAVLPARGIGVTFELWVAVTLLVSVAEELLLRGALFGAASSAVGIPATLLLTSLAFALMHVPFYGWDVVPLDFAVGLWLGGLRLVTGRVSAPAAAHAIADLAAWWL